MSKNYKVSALKRLTGVFLLLLFSAAIVRSQTVLVSPAAEGGFESGTGSFADNGWTVVTGSTNNWYTGTGLTSGAYAFPTTSRCAFVSNNGTNWAYSSSTNQSVHFYRDVTFPAGQTVATLSFKFQQNGNNARLLVYLCDTTMTPVAGQPNSGSVNVGAGSWGTGNLVLLTNTIAGQAAGTVTYTVSLPPAMLGNCTTAQQRRIVFTWNSSTSATNPPAAVDEIAVIASAPAAASAGTFTINNTQPTSGTNFNNFTDAINWANAVAACGLSNPVTINVTAGQVFNENVPMLTASASSANPIVFRKSGSGANPQIRPDGSGPSYAQNIGTVDYGLCLMGAEYITFDGIDIQAANANVEYGIFVGIASPSKGSSNNTIKNCTIMLDRSNTATKAIVQSASAISAFGAGINVATATSVSGTNRNNAYLNLTIGNTYSGIVLYGASENLADDNTTIATTAEGTFNTIGRENVTNDIGGGTALTYAIYGLYQKNVKLYNNKISNVSAGASADGIILGHYSSTYGGISGIENSIYNNIITKITNTSATSTANVCGIRILHETSQGLVKARLYNNVISKINSSYAGNPVSTRALKGIYLQTTTNSNTAIYEVVNNTVIVDAGAANVSNIAFEAGTNSVAFVLRNNLFVNRTGPQTGSATHYVWGVATVSPVLGAPGTVSDYNDVYLENATNGSLGLNNLSSLAAWQTNYSTDVNSISADPLLNSADVLFPLYTSPLVKACPSLSSPYNKDVLGNMRNATQSTIGAYERSGDIIAPLIRDTFIMGTSSTSNRVLSGLLYVTDQGSAVANASGSLPRIYFKKSTDANVFGLNQSSANGWKWVEASNQSSPFSFTIDYSLLQAPVALHDVIQYFFVAQDTVAVPNVAAIPSAGFTGSSVAAVSSAPSAVRSYVIYNTPASFSNATVASANPAKVITGEVNREMVRLAVQTTASGDSGYVTAITFNSNGLNDYTNISNAKIWYTGGNSTFSATKQFGTTVSFTSGSGALGNVTVYGAQVIPPGATSYFWLTYDIRDGAVPSDSVDADILSLVYDGTQEPLVQPAAPGNRIIKSAYCIPVLSSNSYGITNVKLNTLNNTSSIASPYYTNYNPAGTATTTLSKGLTYPMSVTTSSSLAGVIVFIDFNDNGVFDDPEETILVTRQSLSGTATIVPVTIPCNAVASPSIRMRVRSFYYSNYPLTGCTTHQPGEIEDYTIAVQGYAPAYVSSSLTQQSGLVAPGATNRVLARIPVVAQGCGTATINEVHAHTGITNNPGAILQVKLYATGTGKTFQPSKLLATANAVSGNFILNGFSDTLSMAYGDTSFYWITYDIAPGAAVNDTIDVRVDSLLAVGGYHVPANNNPAAYLLVKPVNAYVSTSVVNPAVVRTPKTGQLNSPVMQVRIITTNTGAPKQVTSFTVSAAGGGNDTANIARAKIFYTGNSPVFTPALQFGNSHEEHGLFVMSWPDFTITGSQYLVSDTNYFWVAYDIKETALLTDSVDAGLVSFVLDGITQSINAAPAGNYMLTPGYCVPSYQGSSSPATYLEELLNVTFGSLNKSSTCAETGGNESVLNIYSDYTELVSAPDIRINEPVSFSLTGRAACLGTTASNSTVFKIYIDYNHDGDFDDAGENAYTSPSAAGSLTVARTVTGTVVAPCDATLGLTRMRVVYAGANIPTASACGVAGWYGETEDYTINLVANPVYYATANATQTPGLVAPGATATALRVAVKTGGCGTTSVDALYFHTAGTAAAGSISEARLYTTGKNSTYTNPVLLNSVASPSGAFGFSSLGIAVVDHVPADTTYFWLVYDAAVSAATGFTLDAVLDSVSALGMHTVVNGNPAGELTITAKMAFAGADAIHPNLSTVSMGVTNRAILRLLVRGTTGGAPVNITGLSFSTNGGVNDLDNIDSARVFYTGTNPVFSTATQFGTAYAGTTNPWGTYTINGNQSVAADSVYFWLAYDIKPTANLYDSVDAEFTSVIYDGISQTVTNGAPAGSIGIKNEYCAASGFSTAFNVLNITNVTVGGLNNSTTCGSANTYGNFTALAPAVMPKGSTVNFNLSAVACGFMLINQAQAAVYIDFDQDGTFSASERVYSNTAFDVFGGINAGIQVPCNARTGLTRMRVIINLNPISSPCGTATQVGEVEDYSVNITDNPIVYQMSVASQETGTIATGGLNQQVMRLKVKATGCGVIHLTALHLNTASSTNPSANLNAVKLYGTGTSPVFGTTKLVASALAPNGSFVLNTNDTLLPDTNNYWITYDVSSGATNGALADVSVDSIRVETAYYIPANNNPAAAKTIEAPLTFNSADASHPGSDRIAQGTNVAVAQVRVITNGPGAPIHMNAVNLATTGGGTDTANLASAALYYTGASNVFSAANQFGSTYIPAPAATSAGKWLPYTINGNLALMADTNYFWLVYALKADAVTGDSVDAVVNSVVVEGTTQMLATASPAGNYIIRKDYCVPGIVSGRCIDTVEIGGINNYSGTSCASPYYTLYPNTGLTTTNVYAGSSLPVYLTFATATKASVFIDLNRNGEFETTEEYNLTGNINLPVVNSSIAIPVTAALGETRLRIRSFGGQSVGVVTNRACDDWNQSETEDYTINILPALPQTTYVWNKSAAADFMVDTNWTPARVAASPGDRLVFGGNASEIHIYNVAGQVVKAIEVKDNTSLLLDAPVTNTLTASDSLVLGLESSITASRTLTMAIGVSTGIPGTLIQGYHSGMDAKVKRWITGSGAVQYPITDAKGSKAVSITYQSAPVPGSLTIAYETTPAGGSGGFPLYESATGTYVNKATEDGYWEFTPGDGLSGGIYDASFRADSLSHVQSPQFLVMINRSNPFNNWILNGNHAFTSGSIYQPELFRTSVYGYGQFTVGSDSVYNPLPVSLLQFNGEARSGDAWLNWTTASERNNLGFDVERSADGRVFVAAGFVKGTGNSNCTTRYTYTDEKAFALAGSNNLYYRLKQRDQNGTFVYSNTIRLLRSEGALRSVSVYPNPAGEEIFVRVFSAAAATVKLQVYDMSGRLVNVATQPAITGDNVLSIPGWNELTQGVYFLRIESEGVISTEKVVKN